MALKTCNAPSFLPFLFPSKSFGQSLELAEIPQNGGAVPETARQFYTRIVPVAVLSIQREMCWRCGARQSVRESSRVIVMHSQVQEP